MLNVQIESELAWLHQVCITFSVRVSLVAVLGFCLGFEFRLRYSCHTAMQYQRLPYRQNQRLAICYHTTSLGLILKSSYVLYVVVGLE